MNDYYLESNVWVRCGDNLCDEGEGAVIDFHTHSPKNSHGRLNVKQVQLNGLVVAEHVTYKISSPQITILKLRLGSQQRFWPCCHENGFIMTFPMMPHNLFVSLKSASLYCELG